MVWKDLGTLSQTLLKNFLKEVFKNFKNFKQGDFRSLLFIGKDFGVAVFRAANSGCSRAKFRQAEFCQLTLRSRYRIEMVGKVVVD